MNRVVSEDGFLPEDWCTDNLRSVVLYYKIRPWTKYKKIGRLCQWLIKLLEIQRKL